MPTQIFDWGKNQANVSKLFAEIGAQLKQIASPVALTDDTSRETFEILDHSEVENAIETVDREDFPIDNRFGSNPIDVEHEFSKTVTNQITIEQSKKIKAGLGLDLMKVLSAELSSVLSRKLGCFHGESITRKYSLRFSVKPGDRIIYSVIWKRHAQSGTYLIKTNGGVFAMPFQAHFGLTYEIQTDRDERESST